MKAVPINPIVQLSLPEFITFKDKVYKVEIRGLKIDPFHPHFETTEKQIVLIPVEHEP